MPHVVSINTSKPSELKSSKIQLGEEYSIAKSVTQIGYLYPVLKDVHGNVIDGYHMLNIDTK